MQCKCGSDIVYYRRYEARGYCMKCFLDSVEKKFRRTVSKNKLIRKGDKVAVAVSGGKDSLSMLYLLNGIAKGFSLISFSVDEGISGYRPKGIECAAELARFLGIEHHVYSYRKEIGMEMDSLEELAGKKVKNCTYCGVFRRYVLNKKARELGAAKLAVGHNLDDEAQSVMMNFVRGDLNRFSRLGASPGESPKFVPRIKPLRDIPEKEIAAYAVLKGIKFSGDECPHSFDNVRRDMQGVLNDFELKYPGTKQQVVGFYDRLRGSLPLPGGSLKECEECGEPSSGALCKACELLFSLKVKRPDQSS
ncbi:MAG: TIGR00269 family protein [Candidatus Aenigmarchaeota archaeon]|nr:TIGR00269 family protein [Candidatus Aenigmarchaeota archaeon]